MKENTKKIYIMSGTHWDREWYRPFQGFRYKLVHILTEVIETLEKNPDFGIFTLDGQTVVLNDYLLIRPDMEERLIKLIRGGRILIGPWYCMPDEFLISGESMIKNLLKGAQMSRKFGVMPWKYGYLCDTFGHAAQTPQIFNGFDMNYALVGRGVNEATCPAHFIWESPDGSNCITYKVPDHMLYGDFNCTVLEKLEDCQMEEEKDGLIEAAVQREFSRTEIPVILLMDALDHKPIHIQLGDICERIRRLFPDTEVLVGDARDMAEHAHQYRELLPVRTGQLIETAITDNPAQRLIVHTLSSRYDIKRKNDICQTLTEKWLAPFMVLSDMNNQKIPRAFLDIADDYLIKNQAHDSICGCSIDPVHRDMHYRYDQVEYIAQELLCDVMHEQGKAVARDPESENIIIQLYNPLPYRRKETVTVEIPFEADYPYKYADEPYGYEWKNAFRIKDQNGTELPYNLLEIRTNTISHHYEDKVYEGDLYKVSFLVELEPMGMSHFTVYYPEKESMATRYLSGLATGFQTAENKYLKLKINDNGTIMLTDKQIGRTFDNLLYFIDDSEIGDGWNHVQPTDGRMLSSIGSECSIELVTDGPAQCTFGVTIRFRVPQEMAYRKGRSYGFRPSEKSTILLITNMITLKADSRYLEIETSISNSAKDHRVRAVFPTNEGGNVYFASQAFAMVEQNVGRDYETDDFNESGTYEKPMSGIVGKRGIEGNGLAVISAYGLHECACFEDHSIAVTLYRCFDKTTRRNGEPDGQLQGDLNFKFAIFPFGKEDGYGALQKVQGVLATGIQAYFIHHAKEETIRSMGIMELDGDDDLCFSILKPAIEESGMILRVYNIGENIVKGVVKTRFTLRNVTEVKLNEEEIRPLNHTEHSFDIVLPKYAIRTFKIYHQFPVGIDDK